MVYSREPRGPGVELGTLKEAGGAARDATFGEALTPLSLRLLASLHRRFNVRRLSIAALREAPPGCGTNGAALDGDPRDADPRGSEPLDAGPHDPEPRDASPRAAVPRDVAPHDADPRGAGRRDADPRNAAPHDAGSRAGGPRGAGPPPDDLTRNAPALSIRGEPVWAELFEFVLSVCKAPRPNRGRFVAPVAEPACDCERRLWIDVFAAAEEALGLHSGTVCFAAFSDSPCTANYSTPESLK